MPRFQQPAPRWLVALGWLFVSGCAGPGSLLPSFWGHGNTAPSPTAGPPNHAPGTAPPGTAGAPSPGTAHPLAAVEVHPERLAELTQRLAVSEDERKALAARAQLLETALEDKEKALAQVGKEIQSSRDEVTRVRAELQRSRQEITDIRNRLRSAEKDNLATLQSIVSMLEQMVEPDKPAEGKRETGLMEPAR
jgi:Trp operon repressor